MKQKKHSKQKHHYNSAPKPQGTNAPIRVSEPPCHNEWDLNEHGMDDWEPDDVDVMPTTVLAMPPARLPAARSTIARIQRETSARRRVNKDDMTSLLAAMNDPELWYLVKNTQHILIEAVVTFPKSTISIAKFDEAVKYYGGTYDPNEYRNYITIAANHAMIIEGGEDLLPAMGYYDDGVFYPTFDCEPWSTGTHFERQAKWAAALQRAKSYYSTLRF